MTFTSRVESSREVDVIHTKRLLTYEKATVDRKMLRIHSNGCLEALRTMVVDTMKHLPTHSSDEEDAPYMNRRSILLAVCWSMIRE
jgi:hypothetical protein